MLEKSSAIVLTEDDIEEAKKGVVSKRVTETWNLTLPELQEVVKNNDYVTIDNIRDESK